MSEFGGADYFLPALILAGSIAFVAVVIVIGFFQKESGRGYLPNGRHLAVVDLLSFLLGGASIIGFFLNASIAEDITSKHIVSSGSTINFGDPYDPEVIYPELEEIINRLCPENPECTEVIDEYRSWRSARGAQYLSEFTTGNNAPIEVRDLIAKFNYGLQNHLNPAFGNDARGVINLLLLCLLTVAYSLGLWRRIHVLRSFSK